MCIRDRSQMHEMSHEIQDAGWRITVCIGEWRKKKERLPGLNLEPTVVHMRSTIPRRLLTIDSERLSWIRMYTHCLLCYRSAQWFRGNSVKYDLVLLPSVMQATISMMFTASAPVLYFYSEGFYNVNKMLTRTNFAKSVRLGSQIHQSYLIRSSEIPRLHQLLPRV